MPSSRSYNAVCVLSAAAVASLGAAALYLFTTSRGSDKRSWHGFLIALRALVVSTDPLPAEISAASRSQAVSEAVATAPVHKSTVSSSHATGTAEAALEQTQQAFVLSDSADTYAGAAAATEAPDGLCSNHTLASASWSQPEGHAVQSTQRSMQQLLQGQPDREDPGLPCCQPHQAVQQTQVEHQLQGDQHWQEVTSLAEECQEQQLEAFQKPPLQQLASSSLRQPGQLSSVPHLQSLQQHVVATGPPSERDKAIMYRLAIDKSIWDSNSNKTSRGAADEHIGNTANLRSAPPGDDHDGYTSTTAAAGCSGVASTVIAAFERSLSRQASTSNPTSPRDSITSPRGGRQRQVFNTARNQPSLDTTVSTAAVARSLAVQYSDPRVLQDTQSRQDVCCLSSSCALLCKQHCSKLQEAVSELGETTALDIGCGTGGSCFELALSFSHVLGLDGDAMHVVAAKELKERGQLKYRPVPGHSAEAVTAVTAASSPGDPGLQEQLQNDTCVARVSQECDRDKVRFWCYPLPELPPKLQPVDAVVVEDVGSRLNSGLFRVCQQLPALLKPGGVCVIVLPGSCSNSVDEHGMVAVGAADGEDAICCSSDATHSVAACLPAASARVGMVCVRQWLQELGLQFVQQQDLLYPVAGAPALQGAVAGVWLQPK